MEIGPPFLWLLLQRFSLVRVGSRKNVLLALLLVSIPAKPKCHVLPAGDRLKKERQILS